MATAEFCHGQVGICIYKSVGLFMGNYVAGNFYGQSADESELHATTALCVPSNTCILLVFSFILLFSHTGQSARLVYSVYFNAYIKGDWN